MHTLNAKSDVPVSAIAIRMLSVSLCLHNACLSEVTGYVYSVGALVVASVCVTCGVVVQWVSLLTFCGYTGGWRGGINCVSSVIQSIQGRKSFIVQNVIVFIIFLACVLLEIRQRYIVRWTCLGCLGRTEPEQRAEPDVNLARYITENAVLKKGGGRGVLLIIPKEAIITVADAMQKILVPIVHETSLTAWGKFLVFCHWGIRRPEGQKSDVVGNVSLATKVKRQVSDFMEEARLPLPE